MRGEKMSQSFEVHERVLKSYWKTDDNQSLLTK